MTVKIAPKIFVLLLLAGLVIGCRSERTEQEAATTSPPVESAQTPAPESASETESQPQSTSEAPSSGLAEDDKSTRALPMPGLQSPDTSADSNTSAKDASDEKPSDKNADSEKTSEGAPDVNAVMGAGSPDNEIDPEIQAHIDAQREALRRIADTYAAPPGAKQLGKQPDLWVDMKSKRVYVDGYVAMQRGPLEMLACPVGTKEHESVVAVFAKSSEVHAALLAIGARSGHPVRWDPEFSPPTGQTIQVWIAWRDPQPQKEPSDAPKENNDGLGDEPSDTLEFMPGEEFSVVDARKWVRNVKTKEELAEPWVFAGSEFWSDPEDNIERYSADAGDMICVSNFTTAMLDVPFQSSADTGNLLFEPFTERVPVRGTPVRLVLVPQPNADENPDGQAGQEASAAPDESILPIADADETAMANEPAES